MIQKNVPLYYHVKIYVKNIFKIAFKNILNFLKCSLCSKNFCAPYVYFLGLHSSWVTIIKTKNNVRSYWKLYKMICHNVVQFESLDNHGNLMCHMTNRNVDSFLKGHYIQF
jgi:hypothetical protein